MDNERYFTEIRDEYKDAIEFSSEIYANIGAELGRRLRGRVIDFGNGGVVNYATDNIDKLLCVDLVDHSSADTDSKIEFVCGDFYEFEFPPETDFVLAQFLLHHLPDEKMLEHALSRLRESLGPDGRFVIVEMLMPSIFERLQSLVRPMLFALLGRLGKPPLRFFSRRSLENRLRLAGFSSFELAKIDVGKRIAPAPVLFPRLRIPGRAYPLTCVVIEAGGG